VDIHITVRLELFNCWLW